MIYLGWVFLTRIFAQRKNSVFVLKVSQPAKKTAEAHGPEWELCFLVRLVLSRLFGLFVAAMTATFRGKNVKKLQNSVPSKKRAVLLLP